ncbi:MAG: fused MFS/spermidine synthase [Acidobacteriaceae bacterium]|nr:fused MFS/spermidine synthase [Acidobacteriaceae bacterium]
MTILWSACLLFLVQPLMSKVILPWFGGSAALWITCLVFFQCGLLLGYLYAHALTRRLSVQTQTVIHSLLLLASLAALPILPNPKWQPQPGQDPTWLIFGVLATSVGLPYVLLSATTPLLQSWYAHARQGALPYRYFALSNAGSLLALFAYPILLEPHFAAHQQIWIWSLAFAAFVALCVGTAVLVRPQAGHRSSPAQQTQSAPALPQIALWLSLAACAATLLLTVTNLLTQNIAPMPLLWVLPLSIYLVTLILAFERGRWYPRIIFLPLVIPAIGWLVVASGRVENQTIAIMIAPLCAALFVCAMACHGELARSKPPAPQLTAFYLCVAAGGAVGGLFVAVIAPHFFRTTYEYAITFAGCPALLLFLLWRERTRWKQVRHAFAAWATGAAATLLVTGYLTERTWRDLHSAVLLERNFYGVLRVEDVIDHHHRIRQLTHGTITHGLQFLSSLLRAVPTTYYSRESGVGRALEVLQRTGPLRIGVVGLGAGTLAAYGRAGDTLRFYEINPLVSEIARNQFTFLSDCPAHIDVVLGDARISLAHEAGQQLDLLVLDAFSSDAIPVHLLTREAFALYWRHLKPDGVLAVHISNRYLNLAPVVMLAAKESGKPAWEVDNEDDDAHEIYSAGYVLISSRPNFFTHPTFEGELIEIDPPRTLRPWTDDYSNLWQVLNYTGK